MDLIPSPHQGPKAPFHPQHGLPLYPLPTPSEALLGQPVGLILLRSLTFWPSCPEVDLKAVVADTQFSDKLTLHSLLLARVPFVGKMRGRVKVFWGGETYRVRELLDLLPQYYRGSQGAHGHIHRF